VLVVAAAVKLEVVDAVMFLVCLRWGADAWWS